MTSIPQAMAFSSLTHSYNLLPAESAGGKPSPVCTCRYLNRIEAAVNGLKQETDGAPVTLLAHSAGGWLGRLYLLGFGTSGIDRLVSIGSPHQPPPQVGTQSRALQVVCAPVRRLPHPTWDWLALLCLLGCGTAGAHAEAPLVLTQAAPSGSHRQLPCRCCAAENGLSSPNQLAQ